MLPFLKIKIFRMTGKVFRLAWNGQWDAWINHLKLELVNPERTAAAKQRADCNGSAFQGNIEHTGITAPAGCAINRSIMHVIKGSGA